MIITTMIITIIMIITMMITMMITIMITMITMMITIKIEPFTPIASVKTLFSLLFVVNEQNKNNLMPQRN